jgi:hypothetical protein
MRKGLLSSVATALVGAGSALAQNPYYLPTDNAGLTPGVPALLSAEAGAGPVASAPAPVMSGGSTGLVPGVDCLPAAIPNHPKFYGDVAYMLTWVKEGANPGPLAIVAPSGAPLFGPGSAAVIGDNHTQFDAQSGIRATVGTWLGCEGKFGVEAAGFILQRQSVGTFLGSDGAPGSPTIARPFANLNLVPAGADALLVAAPGLPGSITERETVYLWGAEGNAVYNWHQDCHRRTDIYGGFSYTDLHETLGVTSITSIGSPVLVDDAIGTRNQFYAGQIGTRTTFTYGKLSLVASGAIQAGVNHESIDRLGNTSFGGTSMPGGFLVQTSNAGRQTTDKFAVGLPSRLVLGYQVTQNLNAFIGYDFVYITNVVRPGNQTDLSFQSNANGTTVRPVGGFNQTDFWANSLLAGIAVKF